MKFEKVGDTGTIANKVDDAADITRSATAPKSNRYKIQKTIKQIKDKYKYVDFVCGTHNLDNILTASL